MKLNHIRMSVDARGVATVVLDHAGRSANLVSPDWIGEMEQLLEQVASDAAITGVMLTSVKRTFMAGADLNYLVDAYDRMDMAQAVAFSRRASTLHRRLETLGKPVVAVLNGATLGGGCELALACHHRILVDDPRAVVGLPEVSVGLMPGSGGTQRLVRMVGPAESLRLLLTGAKLAPAQALALGLVDAVVAAPELTPAAEAWLSGSPACVQPWDRKPAGPAQPLGLLAPHNAALFNAEAAKIVAQTQRNLPAPLAILATIFEGAQVPFDRALEVESAHFATLLTNPVARNIIRTGFISRGEADKLARRPRDIPARAFESVGVLGAGLMGGGVAHVAAKAGLQVVLLDVAADQAQAALGRIGKSLARDVAAGRSTREAADALLACIRPTADFADLAGCELVVEAVFEDPAVKRAVTKAAEAVLGPEALFATNTSTLPITALAEASQRPQNFIGLHFFSPVDRMALVEVILGQATSRQTLAHALDFIRRLGKTPIVVNDSRGFFTSRVFQTFIHEGAAMVGEGVAPALVENVAKAAGMPIGPLALLDEVTLDLPLKIVDQSIAALGAGYDPPCGVAVMRRMRDGLDRSSRKAGGGFYDYPADGPKRLWRGLAAAFPLRPDQPDPETLKRRFLYIQAMEAARCLEEGVITAPTDGDLGSVLGWGFPAWTGGVLSLIDTLGGAEFVGRCDGLAQAHGPRFSPSPWLRTRAEAGEPFYPRAQDAAAA